VGGENSIAACLHRRLALLVSSGDRPLVGGSLMV
jgi:hypothetical protein